MVEILELDDDYGIFDWPDAVKVYHHGDYSMATRRYTYGSKSEADLETENAELREERDTYRDLVGCMVHPDIPDLLHAENVRLRELVRIAVMYCDSGACDGCPIQGDSGSCPYSDMARELGIEVEE